MTVPRTHGGRSTHHITVAAVKCGRCAQGFEKTSAMVCTGAFRYIRHLMSAAVLLVMTALRDEQECIAHFGDDYRAYMRGTRRFIPFVF